VERVVVLGPGGAGKSELARLLGERTGLPVVHFDRLFWGPGWEPVPRAEAQRRLTEAVAGDRWILDGNFLDLGVDDPRFARADTVFFLDLPRRTCLRRALWRLVRDRGRARPDLPDGASEGFDWPFLRWIWRYPHEDRPRVLRLLEALPAGVDVRHLRSADALTKSLRAGTTQRTPTVAS
jgi:adenylate kinase family enzyme